MKYVIEPLKGIEEYLQFGMSYDDVHKAIGLPSEGSRRRGANLLEFYDDFKAYFDDQWELYALEFYAGEVYLPEMPEFQLLKIEYDVFAERIRQQNIDLKYCADAYLSYEHELSFLNSVASLRLFLPEGKAR